MPFAFLMKRKLCNDVSDNIVRYFKWGPVIWRKPPLHSHWNLAESTQQTFSHSSNHLQNGLYCKPFTVANAWLLMWVLGKLFSKQTEPDYTSPEKTAPWWYKLWTSLPKPHPGSCPFCLWPSLRDSTGSQHCGGGSVAMWSPCRLAFLQYFSCAEWDALALLLLNSHNLGMWKKLLWLM